MVFSSIPPYLDPSNWHQHQIGGSSGSANHNSQLPPPVPPPPPQPHGGSIRPGSMAERARMANIPLPETALKCPRCESTNTKFCYFNNYSLSQPRHFCKACRRYWTRGGALRSVPVGGGCRRNKKSKSTSRSKSPASSVDRQNNPNLGAGAAAAISSNGGGGSATSLLGLTPPQFPPLRFMSSLSHLTAENFSSAADVGLSYSGITATGANEANNNFHSGSTGFLAGGVASLLSGGGGGNNEMWRLPQIQQFPFLGGNLEPSGIYQFIHHGGDDHQSTPFMTGPSHQVRPKLSSGLTKMEDNPDLNLSRQLLGGIPGGNHDQQWNTSTAPAWTDLSSFTSSSTSNPL